MFHLAVILFKPLKLEGAFRTTTLITLWVFPLTVLRSSKEAKNLWKGQQVSRKGR
jgi:hypothetical protein